MAREEDPKVWLQGGTSTFWGPCCHNLLQIYTQKGGCLGSGVTVYGFFSVSPLISQISFGNQGKELRGRLSEAEDAGHLQRGAWC